MPDTLSAMREFRFLQDKRNGGGLTQTEEGRWQELAHQLEQAPAAAPPVDPVVYAQELIAQGYDPVQAFVHVGFSLEQIAASGYDVAAYQQAQAAQVADPQAYAAALIAQGYDAATAYAAAGLPLPAEAGSPVPVAESVPAPVAEPAPAHSHELDFADAELIEEVPHPSIPDDGTAGWTVESRGAEAPATPMTRPELEMWRTPSKPPMPLPEPGPVPNIDTHLPPAEVAPAWEPAPEAPAVTEPEPVTPVADLADLAASAVVAEDLSSPFEPTAPESLPPGVSEAVPPSRELAAVAAPLDLSAAVAGNEAMREVELPEADDAPLELGDTSERTRPPSEAIDARELDLGGGSEEPLPELDLGSASLDVPTASVRGPISQELELPAPDRHQSEWDMDSELSAAAAPAEDLPQDAPAPVEAAAPAEPMSPVTELPQRPVSNTGSLPVLDASELAAEMIPEGVPTRMMPALSVEFLAARTVSGEPSQDWSGDSTSEEIPPPDSSALPEASAPPQSAEPAAPIEPVQSEASPTPEASAEWGGSETSGEPAVAAEASAAPVGAAVGTAWPTLAELSDWSSPDKGEYAAWTANSGGVQPYPEVSQAELTALLVGTPPVPVPQIEVPAATTVAEAPLPAEAPSELFGGSGTWQETAQPDWEPRADIPGPVPVLEAAAVAAPEPASDEWGMPPPALHEAPAAEALGFAMPEAQVKAPPPAEWGEAPVAEADVVLEAGDVVEAGEVMEEVSAPAPSGLSMPPPSIRTGNPRPKSEPPPPPRPVSAAPLQVVIPPATTRKPSVVVDSAALSSPPPSPPKPALEIMPARVGQSAVRAPSVVIDQSLLGEEAPMAVDDSAFTPAAGNPARAQAPSLRLSGERRVIVHMMDGSVRRGAFHDLDLNNPQLTLASQAGITEAIPRDRIKAIFFMLAPGASAPAIEGSKLRVTFTDGRNIVGFSSGYDPNAVGFFIIPADARTNTERVFVLKVAIRGVANG